MPEDLGTPTWENVTGLVKGTSVDTPYLRVEDTGTVFELRAEVTTVGRGEGVDVALDDPSVSRLHAELVRRGPRVYVADLGLSANGTRVNGRPIGRRVLADGDVLSFGAARARGRGATRAGGAGPEPHGGGRARVGGLTGSESAAPDTMEMRRVAAPELTRREAEVLQALCRPALNH